MQHWQACGRWYAGEVQAHASSGAAAGSTVIGRVGNGPLIVFCFRQLQAHRVCCRVAVRAYAVSGVARVAQRNMRGNSSHLLAASPLVSRARERSALVSGLTGRDVCRRLFGDILSVRRGLRVASLAMLYCRHPVLRGDGRTGLCGVGVSLHHGRGCQHTGLSEGRIKTHLIRDTSW